ncbi:hypothetical protein P8452_66308 [Trifolium repens]|nr:hypothetical protein P8452_66308 [Trifolium repens]
MPLLPLYLGISNLQFAELEFVKSAGNCCSLGDYAGKVVDQINVSIAGFFSSSGSWEGNHNRQLGVVVCSGSFQQQPTPFLFFIFQR